MLVRSFQFDRICVEYRKFIYYVILGERSPALSDRANMPYTMSVITELLRIDIARRSFPHYADKDVVIQGHTIPKGKLLLLKIEFLGNI